MEESEDGGGDQGHVSPRAEEAAGGEVAKSRKMKHLEGVYKHVEEKGDEVEYIRGISVVFPCFVELLKMGRLLTMFSANTRKCQHEEGGTFYIVSGQDSSRTPVPLVVAYMYGEECAESWTIVLDHLYTIAGEALNKKGHVLIGDGRRVKGLKKAFDECFATPSSQSDQAIEKKMTFFYSAETRQEGVLNFTQRPAERDLYMQLAQSPSLPHFKRTKAALSNRARYFIFGEDDEGAFESKRMLRIPQCEQFAICAPGTMEQTTPGIVDPLLEAIMTIGEIHPIQSMATIIKKVESEAVQRIFSVSNDYTSHTESRPPQEKLLYSLHPVDGWQEYGKGPLDEGLVGAPSIILLRTFSDEEVRSHLPKIVAVAKSLQFSREDVKRCVASEFGIGFPAFESTIQACRIMDHSCSCGRWGEDKFPCIHGRVLLKKYERVAKYFLPTFMTRRFLYETYTAGEFARFLIDRPIPLNHGDEDHRSTEHASASSIRIELADASESGEGQVGAEHADESRSSRRGVENEEGQSSLDPPLRIGLLPAICKVRKKDEKKMDLAYLEKTIAKYRKKRKCTKCGGSGHSRRNCRASSAQRQDL